MTIIERPYYMKNKEWYYHDEKEGRYEPTDKAPKKLRKAMKNFKKK